jgi:hypothetical protein
MPKKSAHTRGKAPRAKAKAQKSFELVLPEGREPESDSESSSSEQLDQTSQSVTTASPVEIVFDDVDDEDDEDKEENEVSDIPEPTPVSKTPASARLAARRKAIQRAQQRQAASLITAEHFSYVRRDLIFIGSLAIVMFAAIIILHAFFG